jgi:hypothetical protein
MKRPARAANAGIVYENIQAMESAVNVFRECFDRRQTGDIAFDDRAFRGSFSLSGPTLS